MQIGKNQKQTIVRFGALITAVSLVFAPAAHATLQDEINAASAAAAQNQSAANSYHAQAGTLAGQLAIINSQVANIQNQLANSRAKQVKLTAQIEDAKQQLVLKKQILDENIRAIYQQNQLSSLEILASSKNFSDYVDKQIYYDRLKDHVQEATETVRKLKSDLEKQQADLEIAIKQQGDLASALASQQAQQSQLLAQTQGQEAKYQQQAAANNARANELKSQQAAILASQFGGHVSGGSQCGGGYPNRWCSAPQDSTIDSWGMYNRECVSYTAFRVADSGRYMPYWGGRGNANQWPSNARGAGITVDGNPRVGDVAISMSGPYGHAMYVEGVSGGNITVSQYNFGNNGEYSTMSISASGLQFIHF
ncbi:MAG TPA: CHAP domain-containing protein [Candidatus Saccharimonadales bacterium]|nr:CHAP domain-containing protein [Candidatus Saccharimonadales bacterium]